MTSENLKNEKSIKKSSSFAFEKQPNDISCNNKNQKQNKRRNGKQPSLKPRKARTA